MSKILPEEMGHRVGKLSVDLAYIVARYIDTLSEFISKKELFHLQMNTLYVLIDTLRATCDSDVDLVLNTCKQYFKDLEREKHEMEKPVVAIPPYECPHCKHRHHDPDLICVVCRFS